MTYSNIRILFTTLFIGVSISVNAQFNLKTGYLYSYTDPDITNSILDKFNNDRQWLSDDIGRLNVYHGLMMGFRYKPIEYVGFDLTWSGRLRTLKSSGTDPMLDKTIERDLYFRYNSISLAYENYVGWFSFGGSLDFNFLTIKSEVTDRDGRFTVMKDTGLGSHFYISLNAENRGRMSVSLKPYIQIPWTNFDVRKLGEELNAVPDNTTDFNEKYMTFGIMLVFYNGY